MRSEDRNRMNSNTCFFLIFAFTALKLQKHSTTKSGTFRIRGEGQNTETGNKHRTTIRRRRKKIRLFGGRCAKSTWRAIFATSECKNLNLVQSCLLFRKPCRLCDFFPFDCLNNAIFFFCSPQNSNTRSTIFCVSGRSANEILVILFALLPIFF